MNWIIIDLILVEEIYKNNLDELADIVDGDTVVETPSICELVVQLQVHRQSQRILSVCALQWALPLWQLGKSVILSLIVLSFSDVPHGLADDEKEIVTLRSGAAIKSAEKELTE